MVYRFLILFIFIGSVLFSQVNTERLRGEKLSPGFHHDISLNTAFFGGNTEYSNENPVYYVQYAHARLCRLAQQFESPLGDISLKDLQLDSYERKLVLHCARLKDSVLTASTQFAPYQLAQYATNCARLFHSFYEHCPLLKADEAIQRKRRLILGICKHRLATVLDLMGLTAPLKM